MSKKTDINPSNIGGLFIDGNENIYRLIRCDTEPIAYMKKIHGDEIDLEKPISCFAHFVQLKPVRPIEKPKKPRADLGKTHKKKGVEDTEIADRKGDNLFIHTPTEDGDTYRIIIAGSEAVGPRLRDTVELALEKFDGKIPDELTEQERLTIQGILDAGE